MKQPREIWVTNTLSRKREKLATREAGRLTMYSCGPTVYNLIHIGNLRAALNSDLFFRYFRKAGYDVTYVRNYTDVDDKIIARANNEKTTSEEIGRKYIVEVEKDYAAAGMLEPSHKTLATEHIPEMIAIIEKIIAKGQAYVVDGEVNFAIDRFPGYGKLSHKRIDDLIAGARVEVNERKRNPLDFTLWKPAKPGEPSWPSPWGAGRPGWHIECSAMSSKWLGDRIDVHHGGEDLVFPHHENEIAQSEAASGVEPFVGYWLHNAHLHIAKEKMSKSLGNVFLARDFLTQYSGEVARYFLLSVHYRSIIDFSEESIEQALVALERIYEAKDRAVRLSRRKAMMADARAESLWGGFVADCEKTRREIDDAFASDFNTPGALAALFSLIREFNRVLAEPHAEGTPAAILAAQQLLSVLETDIGDVLGVGRMAPDAALKELAAIRGRRAAASGQSRPEAQEIERLIAERNDARKSKDFARADEIRQDLERRGILLKDGPGGTSWKYA